MSPASLIPDDRQVGMVSTDTSVRHQRRSGRDRRGQPPVEPADCSIRWRPPILLADPARRSAHPVSLPGSPPPPPPASSGKPAGQRQRQEIATLGRSPRVKDGHLAAWQRPGGRAAPGQRVTGSAAQRLSGSAGRRASGSCPGRRRGLRSASGQCRKRRPGARPPVEGSPRRWTPAAGQPRAVTTPGPVQEARHVLTAATGRPRASQAGRTSPRQPANGPRFPASATTVRLNRRPSAPCRRSRRQPCLQLHRDLRPPRWKAPAPIRRTRSARPAMRQGDHLRTPRSAPIPIQRTCQMSSFIIWNTDSPIRTTNRGFPSNP